ncbi:MAG: phosphohistidine phosphatase SixA [Planctomycetota bacterium]|jgi:phosphohistidine phosphatase SixA
MKLTALVLAGLLPMAAALSALASPAIQTTRTAAQDQEPAGKVTARQATARRATMIFLRHAEALPRTEGNQNPHLSDAGNARAKLEAKTLVAAGVTRIFATELHRTQETAAPLAKLLGLKVEQYRARNSKAFTNTLRDLKDGEVALVVGHSNTVPVMVQALGGTLQGLDKKGYLPDDQHDRMIVQVLSNAKPDEAMRALQTLDLRIN